MQTTLQNPYCMVNPLWIPPSYSAIHGERSAVRKVIRIRASRLDTAPAISLGPIELLNISNPFFVTHSFSSAPKHKSAWEVLESMVGTFEGPSDLSANLDQYLHDDR
jgi:hypothetical protein